MLNQAPGPRLPPGSTNAVPSPARWRQLRDQVQVQAPLLSAPKPGAPGLCAVCHGPAGRGNARCFQCDLHSQCAPGSLADVVLPVAFAIKGSPHAANLWRYKAGSLRSGSQPRDRSEPPRDRSEPPRDSSATPQRHPADPPSAPVAAGLLLALLLVFLRDHGACAWRAAGMDRPTHFVVVPTARGRPGVHPLRALIAPYLVVPWAELSPRAGGHPVRELDPGRFRAAPGPGAAVLLVDDTWTTGSTAQAAVMPLRRPGASSVAIVVLGRHVGTAGPDFRPETMPFCPGSCAVHDARQEAG